MLQQRPSTAKKEGGGWLQEVVWERRCMFALERVQCEMLLAGFPGEGAQGVVK